MCPWSIQFLPQLSRLYFEVPPLVGRFSCLSSDCAELWSSSHALHYLADYQHLSLGLGTMCRIEDVGTGLHCKRDFFF